MTGTLALTHAARTAIENACARARPREACGVLLGAVREDARSIAVRVASAIELANRAPGLDEFALDPGELVAAAAQARARGFELAGFWHSHPDGPAEPSARDFAYAWASCVTLVAAPAPPGAWRVRAFWRGATRFDELAIVPGESPPHGRLR